MMGLSVRRSLKSATVRRPPAAASPSAGRRQIAGAASVAAAPSPKARRVTIRDGRISVDIALLPLLDDGDSPVRPSRRAFGAPQDDGFSYFHAPKDRHPEEAAT